MMLSLLPVPDTAGRLRPWAQKLRDEDQMWVAVAQKGGASFVAQAMVKKVPFAVETVFSFWQRRRDGGHAGKIDLITNLLGRGISCCCCLWA
ncbi:hypothetical protein ACEN2Y_00780 (plasmid) [Ralstonia solanacearum]|uniref:hypothetical protein n=1 Tax=Ralstonia solanacearum TaxID=305 RepID=UPI0032178F19